MDDTSSSSLHKHSASETFTKTGAVERTWVPPPIYRSWRRCRELSLNPTNATYIPPILTAAELRELREVNAPLLSVAAPVLRDLVAFTRGSGFVGVLTDRIGHVLELAGDRNSVEYARSIRMVPGSDWSERATGTNAMGVALEEQQPVQVRGSDHFFKHLHILTCSAAPIRDARGQVIGSLDMSGPRELAQPHTLGMVVAASRAIERQLCLSLVADERERIERLLAAIVGAVPDAMLVLDRSGRVLQLNAPACRLLRVTPQRAQGAQIRELLGDQPSLGELLATGRSLRAERVTVPMGNRTAALALRAVPVTVGPHAVECFIVTLHEGTRPELLVDGQRAERVRFTLDDMVGGSALLAALKDDAYRAAASDLTVLLLGESGTGKELLAQGIHNASARRDGPFVAVNCGSLPRDLLPSELFGYEPGSFTGAAARVRAGKFEQAHGGTLFLDEIGDMPYDMQVSLLRVLQERQITRLGGARSQPVDVRVIAASNRDLQAQVRLGQFRTDLFYRLDVLTLQVPPLREHPEDIPPLIESFTARCSGAVRPAWSPAAMRALCRHPWPGNVRELENVVQRCVSMARGPVIDVADLPAAIRAATGPAAAPAVQRIEDVERQAVEAACRSAHGNLSLAARRLGVSRPTLYRKLKAYGIPVAGRTSGRLLHT